jgi:hypothetical protein
MKRAVQYSPLAALLCLLLIVPACTRPLHIIPPVPQPDPRNFTWTIDTIALPGSPATLMKSIWGSSPGDVYVVGHNDLPGGVMFHYDGTAWRRVILASSEGGPIQGSIDLSQVIGFTPEDLFAVGGKIPAGGGTLPGSLVVHFDGTSWSEMPVPPGGMLLGIWGLYNSDMWAAGASGTLIRYSTGLTWVQSVPADTGAFTSVGGVDAEDVYALSSRTDTGVHDTTFRNLWHWNGGVWSVVDSFPQVSEEPSRFGVRSVWSLLAITYTSGKGFFKRVGTGWDLIVPAPATGYLNAAYGIANNSLFVVGDAGALYNVDPPGWFRYPPIAGTAVNFYGVWTNGWEVFVVGNDGIRSYVLHGK